MDRDFTCVYELGVAFMDLFVWFECYYFQHFQQFVMGGPGQDGNENRIWTAMIQQERGCILLL